MRSDRAAPRPRAPPASCTASRRRTANASTAGSTCACTSAGPLRARTYAAAVAHRAQAGEKVGAVDRLDVQAGKRAHEASRCRRRPSHFHRAPRSRSRCLRPGRAPAAASCRRCSALPRTRLRSSSLRRARRRRSRRAWNCALAIGDVGDAAVDDARLPRRRPRAAPACRSRSIRETMFSARVAPVRRHLPAAVSSGRPWRRPTASSISSGVTPSCRQSARSR